MAEEIRSIKIKAEIETNKRTVKLDEEVHSFTEAVDVLAEFLDRLAVD